MNNICFFGGGITVTRAFRFLLIIASALVLLSANVRAQNVTSEAAGNAPSRTIIGPIRGADYGPFHNGESPSLPCNLVADAAQDSPILATIGNYVRVYSSAQAPPCDYYGMVQTLLANGLKVIPSAYICEGCAANQTEVDNLITLLNSLSADELAQIPFVVIGNEPISSFGMTVDEVETFISQVRTQGPPGVKVTTAETYYYYLAGTVQACVGNNGNGPTSLGLDVDVVFFDIYPYWQGFSLDQAVSCILSVYGSLNSAYPLDTPIVISETGWPTLTSVTDQQTYWQSVINAARQNNIEYFGFEAFDEAWKSPPAVEATWGLWNATRQPKDPCGIVSFNPPLAAHDFDGNGKSDIAWRDTNGDLAIWLMNGFQTCSAADLGNVPTTYSIIGQRDFNGDGDADLLWRDSSGNLYMWFMNGLTIASTAGLGNVPISWTVKGTADMNGDGMGDLLWQDSAGDLAIWFMNASTISSTESLGTVNPTTWSIVATDAGNILWRNTSGALALWRVNGATVQATGLGTVPSNWQVVNVGDFNGDGYVDLLFRDTSAGTVAIWFTNSSGTVQSYATVGVVPISSGWTIVDTGDYNGDGMSDILWTDTSGDLAIWFMNGATISSTAGLGNVGTSWLVQTLNAE